MDNKDLMNSRMYSVMLNWQKSGVNQMKRHIFPILCMVFATSCPQLAKQE